MGDTYERGEPRRRGRGESGEALRALRRAARDERADTIIARSSATSFAWIPRHWFGICAGAGVEHSAHDEVNARFVDEIQARRPATHRGAAPGAH
jgi:hypothetical protein